MPPSKEDKQQGQGVDEHQQWNIRWSLDKEGMQRRSFRAQG
jgi:hypothetical protein